MWGLTGSTLGGIKSGGGLLSFGPGVKEMGCCWIRLLELDLVFVGLNN